MKVGDIFVDGTKVGWIDLASLEQDEGLPTTRHPDIGSGAPSPDGTQGGGGYRSRGGSGPYPKGPVPADTTHDRHRPDKPPTFRPGLTPRGKAPIEQPQHFSTGDVARALAGRGKGIDRSAYREELAHNPALREKIMRIAENEQGRHPEGTQAVIESLFNRAQMRGWSLEKTARWVGEPSGYYARGSMGGGLRNAQTRAIVEKSLEAALSGSNISNFATDNSSGGLARREAATGAFQFRSTYGGETFFAPGAAERGYRDVNYPRWLAQAQQGAPSAPQVVSRLGPDPNYHRPEQAQARPEASLEPTEGQPARSTGSADLDYLYKHHGHSSHLENGRIVEAAPGQGGGVNPEFAARLVAAGRAYKAETGQEPQYGEMDRGPDVQAIYYSRYRAGTGGIAAAPGRSRHQSGLAVDVQGPEFRDWLHAGGARRFGLHFPVWEHAHKDYPHMELDPSYRGPVYAGRSPPPAPPAVVNKPPPAPSVPSTAALPSGTGPGNVDITKK